MSEAMGIKETKEAMIGMLKLAAAMTEVLKDGAQMSDAVALFAKFQGDEKFKSALMAAQENIAMVPAELKDLSIMEGAELMQAAIPEIFELLKAMKK